MKRTYAVLLSACIAASGSFIACRAPVKSGERLVAVTHVTVIDMTGVAPPSDQTVVIKKDRIAAMGASDSIQIPSGAQVIDGAGKFLIPGLSDMHVHLTAAGEPYGSRKFMIPLLVANGITSVRDMGGYLESLNPLRKEIADGKRIGPSIVYAGPYLDGASPSFQPSLVVTNQAQADSDVHQLMARGVDFIKVQSLLNRDAYFAIAAAARRENIAFVGHVPDRVTAAEAADAGQHSIEHLTNVLRGCSRDEAKLMREQFYVPGKKESAAQSHARQARWLRELANAYSADQAAALIAKFKEKNVWQTPTLILLQNDAFPIPAKAAGSGTDERERYIPSSTLANWKKTRAEQMHAMSPQESTVHAQLLQRSMDLIAQMQKAGVGVLAGTDAPAPYVFPGSGLHEELALLVQAGLTPLQALQSATSRPAEFLGTGKNSGTIAMGKYADLLLLDANPLDDIRNTQKIRAVILRGQYLPRTTLNELLDSARDFAAHN